MQDEYEFAVTSLPEYLADQPTEGLITVPGELRSGARANLLMGVGSNRVDVHRACARAERSLEKRAEPLSALFLAPEQYPHTLATIAWRMLVLNSAHDSSCACSNDEVVDQVLVRYYEARQIGDGLTHDAVRAVASQVDAPAGATVVANPTARARSGLVDARIPGTGPCHFVGPDGSTHAAQLLDDDRDDDRDGFQTMVTGQKVRWVLDLMRASEFAGRQIHAYEVTPVPSTSDQHDILLVEARGSDARIDLTDLKEHMLALGEAGHTMSLKLQAAPVRHVALRHGRDRRLRLVVFHRGRRRGAGDHAGAGARRDRARKRAPERDGRRARRHVRDHDRGRPARRRLRPPRRRRRRRRHLQLLTARRRCRGRPAGRRARHRRRDGSRTSSSHDRRRIRMARVGRRRRAVVQPPE